MTYAASAPYVPTDPTFGFGDSLCYLSDNRVLAFFYDAALGTQLRAFVINTNGKTVTSVGASVAIEDVSGASGNIPVAASLLDATHVAVAYSRDIGDRTVLSPTYYGFDIRVCVLQVVGDTITVGTPVTVDSATATSTHSVSQNAGSYVAVHSSTLVSVTGSFNVSSTGGYPYQRVYLLTLNLGSLTASVTASADLPSTPAFSDSPDVATLAGRYALVTWQRNSGGDESNATWDSTGVSLGSAVNGPPQNETYLGLAPLPGAQKTLYIANDGGVLKGMVATAPSSSLNFGSILVLDGAPFPAPDFRGNTYDGVVGLTSTLGLIVGNFGSTKSLVKELAIAGSIPAITAGPTNVLTVPSNTYPYYVCKLNSSAIIGNDVGTHYTIVYRLPTGGWSVGQLNVPAST